MAVAELPLLPRSVRDEEALFSRDEDDRLIAKEKATRAGFEEKISVVIDGHTVVVPKAVPATDFLGNFIREADGDLKPRSTTIYDAARQLVREGKWTEDDLARRIPVLCHREHLDPIQTFGSGWSEREKCFSPSRHEKFFKKIRPFFSRHYKSKPYMKIIISTVALAFLAL